MKYDDEFVSHFLLALGAASVLGLDGLWWPTTAPLPTTTPTIRHFSFATYTLTHSQLQQNATFANIHLACYACCVLLVGAAF